MPCRRASSRAAPGRITAYKEPTGPGVRVDSCGYLGYAPPPQFDPMFAKLICAVQLDGTLRLRRSTARCARSTSSTSPACRPTSPSCARSWRNRRCPRGRRAHEPVRRASRTRAPRPRASLLPRPRPARTSTPALPRRRARLRPVLRSPPCPSPTARKGSKRPMAGAVIEVRVAAGAVVEAGDVLMVVSAMKMETAVTAPCAGVINAIEPGEVGAAVAAGQIVATIVPCANDGGGVRAAHLWRGQLGPDDGRGRGVAGHRPRPLRPRLEGPGRGPPARPRQADLPRAHRPAARPRHLPRGGQPGRLRLLRRGRRRRRLHPRQPRRRLGQGRMAAPPSSAPTTSPAAAAIPTAPSGPRAAISIACR